MLRPVGSDGRLDSGGAFTPIQRPRVLKRVASSSTRPVTLVIAPAGYGKSTAIQQHLEAIDETCILFRADPNHGQLLSFVRGLAGALQNPAPDARATLATASEKAQSAIDPGAQLARWMHAHLRQFTGVIALDDLHVAAADPQISEFIAKLVDHTKDRTRWILGSRTPLHLPVASWLAYGTADLIVDEHDLRFTTEEIQNAATRSRLVLQTSEVERLLEVTEGWPTALGFALKTSLQTLDFSNINATTRELTYSYLAEQVYASLNPPEREFLQFVAYLDEIDISVVRHAGYDRARAILEDLRTRIAFIYADGSETYRCQNLFRDFIQQQVQTQGDEHVQATQLRGAHALESAGRHAAALRLYSAAGAHDETMRMLREYGFTLFEQGYVDVIHDATDGLPKERVAKEPIVLTLRAEHHANCGRFDRAEGLFRQALNLTDDPLLRCTIALYLGLVLIAQMRDCRSLLEPFLDALLPIDMRAEVFSLYAVTCGRSITHPQKIESNDNAAFYRRETVRYIKQTEALLARIDNDSVRAKVLSRLGNAIMSAGLSEDRALSLLVRAATLATQERMLSLASRAYHAAGYLVYSYHCDSQKQTWYAQQSIQIATKAGDRHSLQMALLTMLNIESLRGDLTRMRAIEQQIAIAETSDADRLVYAIVPRALAFAQEGNFTEATRLFGGISDNKRFYDYDRCYNRAAYAFLLAVDQQRDKVLAEVEPCLMAIDSLERPLNAAAHRGAETARMFCAVAQSILGRHGAAVKTLSQVRENGDIILSATRQAIAAMCQALKDRSAKGEADEALNALSDLGHGGLANVLSVSLRHCLKESEGQDFGLTQAQLHILEALARGDTPKEIAEQTGRSVLTVQSHIKTIIKNFGCSGRTEALAIARRRGAIS